PSALSPSFPTRRSSDLCSGKPRCRMTPEERLRWIQHVEAAGYTVDAEERRGVVLVDIRDSTSYVVRVMHTRRFDFEQAARKFARSEEHTSELQSRFDLV